MADNPTPLATFAQAQSGPLADLFKSYSTPTSQNDLMFEATRACESVCDRRLAPFTGLVETQRAMGLDVEDTLDVYVPLSPTSQLGVSRAQSLGSTLLVRHCWVRESPPRYPDLWTGTITNIQLYRSFSGQQSVPTSGIQYEPDTGHVRFALGTFLPAGTTIQITYNGGYSTSPSDLVLGCKYMAASIAVTELGPLGSTGHNPDDLHIKAMDKLAPYMRGG